MNVAVKVFYIGTKYHGSQMQPGLRTIEGELQKAVNKYNAENYGKVKFSGRTDKGVHSLGQIVVLPIKGEMFYPEKLNTELPEDIIVWAWTKVPPNFNPRRDVNSRTYRYFYPTWNVSLDFEKMRIAANEFIGEHNFSHFAKPRNDQNPVTIIHNLEIFQNNTYIEFKIRGRNFLWMMVRKIIRALIQVGSNELNIETLRDIINLKSKPQKGFQPVPANGLILWDIETKFNFTINKKGIKRIKQLVNSYIFNLEQGLNIMKKINDFM